MPGVITVNILRHIIQQMVVVGLRGMILVFKLFEIGIVKRQAKP